MSESVHGFVWFSSVFKFCRSLSWAWHFVDIHAWTVSIYIYIFQMKLTCRVLTFRDVPSGGQNAQNHVHNKRFKKEMTSLEITLFPDN